MDQENAVQSSVAVKDTPEKSAGDGVKCNCRGIGPEKLSVRIFREVFTRSALASGHLKGNLDDYLRAVLGTTNAQKSDKGYAKQIYTDLIRLVGGNGLPDWADPDKKGRGNTMQPEPPPVAQAVAPQPEALPAAPPAPAPSGVSVVADSSLADFIDPNDIPLNDPADVFLAGAPVTEEPDPYTGEHGLLHPIMVEYLARTSHPFVRVFPFSVTMPNGLNIASGERFAAIGTYTGTLLRGDDAGKKINVNFTVDNYKKRQDIPEDILVHKNGRAVQLKHEDERNNCRFLFVVKHKPGRKIRFWTRVSDVDRPSAAKFILFTNEAPWWKEISRADF